QSLGACRTLHALAATKATDDATTQGTSAGGGCDPGGWNSLGPTRAAMLRAVSRLILMCHGPDDCQLPLVARNPSRAVPQLRLYDGALTAVFVGCPHAQHATTIKKQAAALDKRVGCRRNCKGKH